MALQTLKKLVATGNVRVSKVLQIARYSKLSSTFHLSRKVTNEINILKPGCQITIDVNTEDKVVIFRKPLKGDQSFKLSNVAETKYPGNDHFTSKELADIVGVGKWEILPRIKVTMGKAHKYYPGFYYGNG